MTDTLIKKNIDSTVLLDYFKYLEKFTSYNDILKQINTSGNWLYDSIDDYITYLSESDFPDGAIEEILYNKFGVTILDSNYSKLDLNDSINKIYLDSIQLGNCHLVKKIENIINVTYSEKTKDILLDRTLVLKNNSIGDRFLSNLMKINSCWIPSDKLGKYTGTCWKNKVIQNLILTLDWMGVVYFEFRIDDEFETLDIDIVLKDSDLQKDEAEISSFFYEYQPSIKFIKSIKKISKKRNLHWTSFLLIHIIDWIFVTQKKVKVLLHDESRFINKNCNPYTILYQLAKQNVGMYQQIGFKADPPLDDKLIRDIYGQNYYKYTNEKYNYFMDQRYQDDIKMIMSETEMDYNTVDKCLFNNNSDIVNTLLELEKLKSKS